MAEFEAMFASADTSGDGQLSLKELKEVMKGKGYAGSEDEMREIFKGIDVDADGKISKAEFMAAMGAAPPVVHKKSMWRRVFRDFDKDCSGHISKDELKQVFAELGDSNKTDAELQRMIEMCDKNGDGGLDYEEFLREVIGQEPE